MQSQLIFVLLILVGLVHRSHSEDPSLLEQSEIESVVSPRSDLAHLIWSTVRRYCRYEHTHLRQLCMQTHCDSSPWERQHTAAPDLGGHRHSWKTTPRRLPSVHRCPGCHARNFVAIVTSLRAKAGVGNCEPPFSSRKTRPTNGGECCLKYNSLIALFAFHKSLYIVYKWNYQGTAFTISSYFTVGSVLRATCKASDIACNYHEIQWMLFWKVIREGS